MKPGIYKHYKDDFYLVFGVGKNTETNEDFVAYFKVGEKQLNFRPLSMFMEIVNSKSGPVSRFTYVNSLDEKTSFNQILSLLYSGEVDLRFVKDLKMLTFQGTVKINP